MFSNLKVYKWLQERNAWVKEQIKNKQLHCYLSHHNKSNTSSWEEIFTIKNSFSTSSVPDTVIPVDWAAILVTKEYMWSCSQL